LREKIELGLLTWLFSIFLETENLARKIFSLYKRKKITFSHLSLKEAIEACCGLTQRFPEATDLPC